MSQHSDPLTRLAAHIQKSDCGIICAYREKSPEGVSYKSQEHRQRNRSLLAKLLADGFAVTSIEGWGNETREAEQDEYLFFVRDDLRKGQLESRLKQYAEEFEQDFVLFIPKGGSLSLLIGTNRSAASYGIAARFPILGKERAALRLLHGRPFHFGDRILGEHRCGNVMGRWAASIDARKHWSKLVLPEVGTQNLQN